MVFIWLYMFFFRCLVDLGTGIITGMDLCSGQIVFAHPPTFSTNMFCVSKVDYTLFLSFPSHLWHNLQKGPSSLELGQSENGKPNVGINKTNSPMNEFKTVKRNSLLGVKYMDHGRVHIAYVGREGVYIARDLNQNEYGRTALFKEAECIDTLQWAQIYV